MADEAYVQDKTVAEQLYKARVITISSEISQALAAHVINRLLALSAASSDDIRIFINSQGGHVEAGDTIHDVIRFIKPRVQMIGTGWVASAGALIYVAVPVEQRFCLPNTRFLLHQPAGQTQGRASDIEIESGEIVKMRKRLNSIFARQTGHTLEKIEQDTRRNFWLTAQEAKEYGLVGAIISSEDELQ